RLLCRDSTPVPAPRELTEHPTGMRAKSRAQGRSWRMGKLADSEDAKPMQLLGGCISHAPHGLYGERVQEGHNPGRRDFNQSVGLGCPRGDLGNEFGRTDAHRTGDLLFIRDHSTHVLPDLYRAAEHPYGTG